jgi:hypothetical protein
MFQLIIFILLFLFFFCSYLDSDGSGKKEWDPDPRRQRMPRRGHGAEVKPSARSYRYRPGHGGPPMG